MKLRKIVILIVLIVGVKMNAQVLPKPEIEALLEAHKLDEMDFIQQLQSTAFLYKLPNDTFIVFNSSEDYGLLVKGKAVIEKMILEDSFPIDLLPKNGQPIEYERENILQINKKAEYYRRLLNAKTGLKHETVNEESLRDYLKYSFDLDKKDLLGSDGFVALLSIVGEYAIDKFNGKWALRKVYLSGYNPSFEPVVIKNNQKTLFVNSRIISFLNNPEPGIDFFINYNLNLNDAYLNDFQKVRNLVLLD